MPFSALCIDQKILELFYSRQDLLLNYRGAWFPHLVEVYFVETHLFVLSRSYLVGNLELI